MKVKVNSQDSGQKNTKSQYVSVNLVYTDDERMRKLNQRFLNKDENTDVLAFPMNDRLSEGVWLLGEIVVNKAQAKRQAIQYGVSEREEVARLITHGALHLLGFEDGDEKRRKEMEKAQERIVSQETK